VDNPPPVVDNLGKLCKTHGASSPDTRHPSPRRAILHVMDEYDADRDGELLPARDVAALLHISRSALPLWRARGDLVGYQMRNGHWRYPSHQATLVEARQALRAAR
jgi:hypothetical protein